MTPQVLWTILYINQVLWIIAGFNGNSMYELILEIDRLLTASVSADKLETSLLSRLWDLLGLGERLVNEIAWLKASCDWEIRSSTDFFLVRS